MTLTVKLVEMSVANVFQFVLSITVLCTIVVSKFESRIIGGQDGAIGQFSWSTSIRDYSGHFCGGAVISRKHILTAAHCLRGHRKDAKHIFVVVGAMTTYGDGILNNVENISIHPEFRMKPLQNDIAILCTAAKIVFSDTAQPIELPSSDLSKGGSFPAFFSGFGRTMMHSDRVAYEDELRKLQWISVTAEDHSQCFTRFEHSQLFSENFELWSHAIGSLDFTNICTVNQNGQGACIGDSGSPLVSQNDNTLIGILSWSIGCAENYPDVYTNVFHYTGWIESETKIKPKPRRDGVLGVLQFDEHE